MWMASDTWKGAGCSKSGGFGIPFDEFKTLTDERVDQSIAELKELDTRNPPVIDPLNNFDSANPSETRAVFIMSGSNDPVVPRENQEA
jgi:hypothetical protein